MPINKLNWIDKIQIKSLKHASNNIGPNLSRKLTAENVFFYLTKNCLNFLNKFMHTEDENCSYSKNISSFGVTE